MYKIAVLLLLFLTGCSYFSINATMCEQIAMDPQNPVPEECRNYVEEEAEKASKSESEVLSPSEVIEFTQE